MAPVTLKKKAIKATERYLDVQGMQPLDFDTGGIVDLVALDDDAHTVHFIDVSVCDSSDTWIEDMEAPRPPHRSDLERLLVDFCEAHDLTDKALVYSRSELLVINPNRAIMRFISAIPLGYEMEADCVTA